MHGMIPSLRDIADGLISLASKAMDAWWLSVLACRMEYLQVVEQSLVQQIIHACR